ncbi:MAG: cobalamin biosynthesis protein [Lachnospiraceae bacterium]|nr:cobalamin biosynthesis protein [Lachnospiraceae bacterium]
MKISIFTASERGSVSAVSIKDKIENGYDERGDFLAEVYIKSNHLNTKPVGATVIPEDESLEKYVKMAFSSSDALIFLCACGIAVRTIAPYVNHKSSDPAVLVIDEHMHYCIPLLSGHLGGANELARRLSDLFKMIPVITTASDLDGLTAVDVFAKDAGLAITDYVKAKDHTAALLAGETVYVINEMPETFTLSRLPAGYEYAVTGNADDISGIDKGSRDPDKIKRMIRISCHEDEGTQTGCDVLTLVPRVLKLGIGCRRGTSAGKIKNAVLKCFSDHGLFTEAIEGVYSIDLKNEEEGIISFCREYNVPFTTYSADELAKVQGNFTPSGFVDKVTGVDNVCERSAAASGGRILVRKEIYDGVTVAIGII